MEKTQRTSILELKAIYLALLTFTKEIKNKIVHLQINNIFALIHLLRVEGISELRNDKNFQGNLDVFI